MLAIERSFFFIFNNKNNFATSSSCLFLKSNNVNCRKWYPIMCKKDDASKRVEENHIFPPLRVSKTLIAQSLVVVLGLGFIDAGYSGDWSRIGVISKETEELLKLADFVIVPLAFFLIFYLAKKPGR